MSPLPFFPVIVALGRRRGARRPARRFRRPVAGEFRTRGPGDPDGPKLDRCVWTARGRRGGSGPGRARVPIGFPDPGRQVRVARWPPIRVFCRRPNFKSLTASMIRVATILCPVRAHLPCPRFRVTCRRSGATGYNPSNMLPGSAVRAESSMGWSRRPAVAVRGWSRAGSTRMHGPDPPRREPRFKRIAVPVSRGPRRYGLCLATRTVPPDGPGRLHEAGGHGPDRRECTAACPAPRAPCRRPCAPTCARRARAVQATARSVGAALHGVHLHAHRDAEGVGVAHALLLVGEAIVEARPIQRRLPNHARQQANDR